jgi:hypothetical protein
VSERKYRAQILLEPEQHEVLAEQAQREGHSISHVVREIVAQYLTAQELKTQEKQQAFMRLGQLREKILAGRGGEPIDVDISSLIAEAREERADELLANLNDDRS